MVQKLSNFVILVPKKQNSSAYLNPVEKIITLTKDYGLTASVQAHHIYNHSKILAALVHTSACSYVNNAVLANAYIDLAQDL